MSRGAKHRNDMDIFTFPLHPPERPKSRLTPRPNRNISVRLPPSTNGKLTTAERLKLARERNGKRLTQSIRRQNIEREKAEACKKLLKRRNEDPNLVWDLTGDAPLADHATQLTQSDELVSDDDEDEQHFAHPPVVRNLFASPECVSRQTETHLGQHNACTHVTELSDHEDVPRSRLKKRRVAKPRKRVGIPITSSVFAPNVRSAIATNTAERSKPAYLVPKQRTPLTTINGSRDGSQYLSEIPRPLPGEAMRKEWSPRRSEVSKEHREDIPGPREMILNISTIRASDDDDIQVHQISDDDYAPSFKDPEKQRGFMRRTTVSDKVSRHALKRPRHGRQADRSIPAKTFYGKDKASQSNGQRRRERIVIPLRKGQTEEAPSQEIAQLSLHEQGSRRRKELLKEQAIKPARRHSKGRSKGRIQYESTDDEDEPTRSQTDIRFKPLSRTELEVVRSLTFKVSKNKVMAKIPEAKIDLKAGDFSGLRGSRWLNDEILNSFVALINARNRAQVVSTSTENSTQNSAKSEEDDEIMEVAVTSSKPMEVFRRPRPRTHIFNTFFFLRLSQNGYDYSGVRRWLKRAGRNIKDLDLIMFPINLSNFHWVLAAIDLRGKQFLYLDSTYGQDCSGAIPLLRRWLHDEVADKNGENAATDMHIDSWGSIVNPAYLPLQKDGGSCGIFTLYMAEYLERGRRPDFRQENILTLRQRTALFLKEGRLPDS